jgi:hypothetical protein
MVLLLSGGRSLLCIFGSERLSVLLVLDGCKWGEEQTESLMIDLLEGCGECRGEIYR